MRDTLWFLLFAAYSLFRSYRFYSQPSPLTMSTGMVALHGLLIAAVIYCIRIRLISRGFGYLLAGIFLSEVLARYFDTKPLLVVKAGLSIALGVLVVYDHFRSKADNSSVSKTDH